MDILVDKASWPWRVPVGKLPCNKGALEYLYACIEKRQELSNGCCIVGIASLLSLFPLLSDPAIHLPRNLRQLEFYLWPIRKIPYQGHSGP